MTPTLSGAFKREVRRRLAEDYLPKVRRVLERLSEDDVWWRPDERSNSIANLILHLAGNVRQWALSGIGGAPDTRERDLEFTRRGGSDKAALFGVLERAVEEALDEIEAIPDDEWLATRVIQGYHETIFSAAFHVVEHFSGHVGQMLYIAKVRDLGFPALYGADGSGGA